PFDRETALVVVDVQNDFADPRGGLHVQDGEQVVEVINALIARARAAGAPVVFTQDWHPPETPHFDTHGGVWPVHCVRDTWGAELHPGLDADDAEPVVRKGTDGSDGYSGFSVRDPVSGEQSATELGRILDDRGVRHLVVTGLAGDVCVKETALDGRRRGHDVVVPLAATRFVELAAGDGQRAVDEMAAAGVTVIA
ncbi:MAG: isochorismatase family protein, partial [Nitriliruptoraceae bacterium]